MTKMTRRDFIKGVGVLAGAGAVSSRLGEVLGLDLSLATPAAAAPIPTVYVSKNGTPTTNVAKVLEMAGGIDSLLGSQDVVVVKPNLQWGNQGYTNTEATKALIDLILNRPGGFSGEIIIAENTHGNEESIYRGWAASPENRINNWPDMNYNELVAWYASNGAPNVTAAKLIAGNYPVVSGPQDGQGFVSIDYEITNSGGANGRVCRLYYPIIRSSYSGKMVDTKYGVWENGGYTGQEVKLIFLPTLNNHGRAGNPDYAGATSAVKCHLGFVRSCMRTGDVKELHTVGYSYTPVYPRAVGEAVGELISNVIQPTFYLTVAEWAGWGGRTGTTDAEHTKTVGLCRDPVTLDYWMGRNVLAPCNGGSEASYLDPINPGNFRETLEGCNSKGVGTLDEGNLVVQLYDHESGTTPQKPSPPQNVRFE